MQRTVMTSGDIIQTLVEISTDDLADFKFHLLWMKTGTISELAQAIDLLPDNFKVILKSLSALPQLSVRGFKVNDLKYAALNLCLIREILLLSEYAGANEMAARLCEKEAMIYVTDSKKLAERHAKVDKRYQEKITAAECKNQKSLQKTGSVNVAISMPTFISTSLVSPPSSPKDQEKADKLLTRGSPVVLHTNPQAIAPKDESPRLQRMRSYSLSKLAAAETEHSQSPPSSPGLLLRLRTFGSSRNLLDLSTPRPAAASPKERASNPGVAPSPKGSPKSP